MKRKPPRIKDYAFDRHSFLGEGSYGSVWAGAFRETEWRAVKLFNFEALDYPFFQLTQKKLRCLHQPPGIMPVFHAGKTEDGIPYVAMPLAATYREEEAGARWHSRSLLEMLETEFDSLDRNVRWNLVREIAAAISWMHREGVVHSALKPSNTFLAGKEKLRVLFSDAGQSPGSEFPRFDEGGVYFYASPDQIAGSENAGGRTAWDVYSFGVIAWQVLTGELPRLQNLAERKKGDGEPIAARQGGEPAFADEPGPGRLTLSVDQEIKHLVIAEAIEEQAEIRIPGEFQVKGQKEFFEVILRCLGLSTGDSGPDRFDNMIEVQEAFAEVDKNLLIAPERKKTRTWAIIAILAIAGFLVALFLAADLW